MRFNSDVELVKALAREGLVPDTSTLDQHLLTNMTAIRHLVELAELTREEAVLEIGCGPGVITELLAQRAGRVVGIEFDQRFRVFLRPLVEYYSNIEIVYGDALQVSWPSVDKVVTNPPFKILESLLRRLHSCSLRRIVMVAGFAYCQSARAAPGESHYNRLSLLTQSRFSIDSSLELQSSDFHPPVRTSACALALTQIPPEPVLCMLNTALMELAGRRVKDLLWYLGSTRSKVRLDTSWAAGELRSMSNRRLQTLSNEEVSHLVQIIMAARR